MGKSSHKKRHDSTSSDSRSSDDSRPSSPKPVKKSKDKRKSRKMKDAKDWRQPIGSKSPDSAKPSSSEKWGRRADDSDGKRRSESESSSDGKRYKAEKSRKHEEKSKALDSDSDDQSRKGLKRHSEKVEKRDKESVRSSETNQKRQDDRKRSDIGSKVSELDYSKRDDKKRKEEKNSDREGWRREDRSRDTKYKLHKEDGNKYEGKDRDRNPEVREESETHETRRKEKEKVDIRRKESDTDNKRRYKESESDYSKTRRKDIVERSRIDDDGYQRKGREYEESRRRDESDDDSRKVRDDGRRKRDKEDDSRGKKELKGDNSKRQDGRKPVYYHEVAKEKHRDHEAGKREPERKRSKRHDSESDSEDRSRDWLDRNSTGALDASKSSKEQTRKRYDSDSDQSDQNIAKADEIRKSESFSSKRRHRTDSGSDDGFDEVETSKKTKYSHDYQSGRSSFRRPYRDLDAPEPEPLPRYWDSKHIAERSEKSRTRSPVLQVGERYWDKNSPEEKENIIKEDAEKDGQDKEKEKEQEVKAKKKEVDILTTRTGGAYIPPARLRLMQQEISDKSSIAYQRLAWEALKKSIHGLINKVNVSNIALIVRQLFKENVVRGRGLLCRSIMQAQASSQTFTHVYAALVAIINTKFPNIGELLLKRLILLFKRGFKRNDKNACISSSKFIGHLVNQQVAHELIALEILTLLLEKPTDDSVEIAIGFLKEVGMKLSEVSPRGLNAVFESLRHVLNESMLDKRVQYMIEVMYQVRKDGFKDNPSVIEELDLVEEEEQMTHILTLEEVLPGSGEDILNVFKHDPEYEANEQKYDAVRREILGEEEEEGSDGGSGESGSDGSDESDAEDEEEKQQIIDETETNLTALRRTIYLTIQSSLDFNECAHKLMKMQLRPGQEVELCNMILDCCAQQRTYEKFFGLLAQRFCQIKREYIAPFEQLFRDSYDTIHRIDIGKLRNVAKLFGHLLFSDAISWEVLSHIHLNEEETTSSSRIFIKILFQELAEYVGLEKLNNRLKDATLAPYFEGLFPRDNPKNTRFSINFFTSIGLGGLTEDLRQHLANQPRPTAIVPPIQRVQAAGENSGSSSSDSSSESSSDSSDSSDSDSSSTDSEVERRIRQKMKEELKKAEKEKNRKAEEKRGREDKQSRRQRERDGASEKRRVEKGRHRRSRS